MTQLIGAARQTLSVRHSCLTGPAGPISCVFYYLLELIFYILCHTRQRQRKVHEIPRRRRTFLNPTPVTGDAHRGTLEVLHPAVTQRTGPRWTHHAHPRFSSLG